MLGESAANHPDELVYGLLEGGFTKKCYDGKPFFAADHKVGKESVSNKGTAQLSMAAYIAARTSIMSVKNSKGRPLALIPDLLVVPPALEATARDILIADYINGTKNTMQGTAEIHVEPRLADSKAWFMGEFIVYAIDPDTGNETDMLYATLGSYIQPVPKFNAALPASIFDFPLVIVISNELEVSVEAPAGLVTHEALNQVVSRAVESAVAETKKSCWLT